MKLIIPCPVCGMEDECPHTPIRCQHEWHYNGNQIEEIDERECKQCGYRQKKKIVWVAV